MGFFTKLFATDPRPAPVRFMEDPEYQKTALESVSRDAQRDHDKGVRNAEKAVKKAQKERQKRIDAIDKAKWKDLGQGVRLNAADGKVIIAKKEYPITSVLGAQGYIRYEEQHDYQTVKNHYREPSAGKAILGGMMFGAPGAIAGAAIGNKKTTSHVEDHVRNVETGRGVVINVNGFTIDVPGAGQPMVDALADAVGSFDPAKVIPTEDLPEIKEMDAKIATLEEAVQKAKDRPLKYVIPSYYQDPAYDYAYDGIDLIIIPKDEGADAPSAQ